VALVGVQGIRLPVVEARLAELADQLLGASFVVFPWFKIAGFPDDSILVLFEGIGIENLSIFNATFSPK
jgi:hypothetical protein